MEKVYLIMVGEYSDRHCVGWCSSEEEARRVCAARNSAIRHSDFYDVEEQECLDEAVAGDVCAGWSLVFDFVRREDGWKKQWSGFAYLNTRHAPVIEKYLCGFGCDAKTNVRVRVWRKDEDMKAAERAALDALYEYIAKQEGVGV